MSTEKEELFMEAEVSAIVGISRKPKEFPANFCKRVLTIMDGATDDVFESYPEALYAWYQVNFDKKDDEPYTPFPDLSESSFDVGEVLEPLVEEEFETLDIDEDDIVIDFDKLLEMDVEKDVEVSEDAEEFETELFDLSEDLPDDTGEELDFDPELPAQPKKLTKQQEKLLEEKEKIRIDKGSRAELATKLLKYTPNSTKNTEAEIRNVIINNLTLTREETEEMVLNSVNTSKQVFVNIYNSTKACIHRLLEKGLIDFNVFK